MTPDQLKALDQMRQRLSQLSTSIQTLYAELDRAQPLPTWSSLQSSAQLLSYNLQQLGELLAAHRTFLRTAHAYPLPSFPGHTHPFILETLLSKKLAPRAEEWISDFTTKQSDYDASGAAGSRARGGGLETEQLTELWNWAGPAESQVVREMLEDGDFEDDFTLAEREKGIEKTVTGLRRQLAAIQSGTDEDDQSDEDAMEITTTTETDATAKKTLPAGIDPSRPVLPLDNILRFVSTGDVHSHVTTYRR